MEKVEVALLHAASTTGEGPHWVEDEQSLMFVDIIAGGVHLWSPTTQSNLSVNFDDFATFVVPHKKGGVVAGIGKQIRRFHWRDHTDYTVLAEVDQGKGTRLNDAKCDPVGRLFAGTMGLETAPAVLPPNMGTLYSLDKEGQVKSHVDKLTISNGMAWTKDSRTMFFADSLPGHVYAFDYDVTTGETSKQRLVHDFTKTPSDGIPDGLCIDADDKIWIACYSSGQVLQIDPQVDKVLRTVKIPAKRTTSCCFGGKNYDELYVTCSRAGYSDEQMAAEDPLAGSLFKVTGLGVKGLPGMSYDGC